MTRTNNMYEGDLFWDEDQDRVIELRNKLLVLRRAANAALNILESVRVTGPKGARGNAIVNAIECLNEALGPWKSKE